MGTFANIVSDASTTIFTRFIAIWKRNKWIKCKFSSFFEELFLQVIKCPYVCIICIRSVFKSLKCICDGTLIVKIVRSKKLSLFLQKSSIIDVRLCPKVLTPLSIVNENADFYVLYIKSLLYSQEPDSNVDPWKKQTLDIGYVEQPGPSFKQRWDWCNQGSDAPF